MKVSNVLHSARWIYRTQKWCKKLPSVHQHTTLSGYIFATKACVDNRKKKLLNSNISSRCPHNMANFGWLTAEIGWRVWGTPANFNGFRILASLLQRRHSLQARCVAISWAGTLYIHFQGCCPLTEFCQAQNSLCVQVLHSPILAASLHSTPASDVSQTLRHAIRNGIRQLPQRVPPICAWAAIMLGIGLHSSWILKSDLEHVLCIL